ncbi:MAG: hypothetical protein ACI9DC_001597 [Gammaproteobacteria bacterium]|jgi:hypothetical protein
MKDAQRDSQPNGARARLTDCCLIAALLLVLAISWKELASSSQDLHQTARQAMTQHVGETSRRERIGNPPFIDPAALHARTAD